jgi:hypothetical protein
MYERGQLNAEHTMDLYNRTGSPEIVRAEKKARQQGQLVGDHGLVLGTLFFKLKPGTHDNSED